MSGSDFEDLAGVVVELAGAIKEIAGVVVELAGVVKELVGVVKELAPGRPGVVKDLSWTGGKLGVV